MGETDTARRGLMLVLSSPSGAGKTTIARKLLEEDKDIEISVSHTTRKKREGERDGKDYHFVNHDAFTRMRDQGEFLEWAVVFDNYYGTTRKPVEQALAEGRDVLFDVDWQGSASLRAKAKDDVVTIFILPPTAADLEQRLNVRAQDPPETVRRRMLGASNEMPFHQMLLAASVLGLADGPTEVHKVTAARQLLRDYSPSEGLWPSQHIPRQLAAAREKYAEYLEHEIGNQ